MRTCDLGPKIAHLKCALFRKIRYHNVYKNDFHPLSAQRSHLDPDPTNRKGADPVDRDALPEALDHVAHHVFIFLCFLDVSCYFISYSLQFDPAPRRGEPHVTRRTPDYFL